jgi:hypothetical protein
MAINVKDSDKKCTTLSFLIALGDTPPEPEVLFPTIDRTIIGPWIVNNVID